MIKKRIQQGHKIYGGPVPTDIQIHSLETPRNNHPHLLNILGIRLIHYFSFVVVILYFSITTTDRFFHSYSNTRYRTTANLPNKGKKECSPLDIFGDISPLTASTDAPIEAIHSIFNCNSQESPSADKVLTGRCKWFFPNHFFNETCGDGHSYRSQLQYLQIMQRNGSLWPYMPSIFLHTVSLHPHMEWKWSYRNEPFQTLNLTMIHVHKTGGSSMVQAYRDLNHRLPKVNGVDHGLSSNVYLVYKPKFTNTPALSSTLDSSLTLHLLQNVTKYPSSWGTNDHILIAMVRDPIQRFISSLGQAMGGAGSKSSRKSLISVQQLVSTCLTNKTHDKSTQGERRQKVLKCAIEYIEKNGYWFDVHFTPMVLEIAFVTGIEQSIPVAIFPFEALPAILYELGANPFRKFKDGSKLGVRPDIRLTEMSVKDLDLDMLRDVCELYRVDVIFMKHLGYSTQCDNILM